MNELRAVLEEVETLMDYYWRLGNRDQLSVLGQLKEALQTPDDAELYLVAVKVRKAITWYWQHGVTDQQLTYEKLEKLFTNGSLVEYLPKTPS